MSELNTDKRRAPVIQLSCWIMPQVLCHTEFWLMLGIHLMTWGGYQSGWFELDHYVASAVSVDWIDLKILTVSCSFFVAFYVNQCVQRYQQLCLGLHRLLAAVHDFAFQARLLGPPKALAPEAQQLGSRWLAGCAVLCLDEFQHTLRDEDWRRHIDSSLVRKGEVEFLRSLTPAQRLLTMCHMTADLCKSQLKEEDLMLMLTRIMHFKQCQQELLDLVQGSQVPFQFRHLLNVMVFLTLLCLAYGMALSESCLAPVLFIIMELVLLGMLDVCRELWNPFRSEHLDFRMLQWKETFRRSLRLVTVEHHGSDSGQWQAELEEERRAMPDLMLYEVHRELREDAPPLEITVAKAEEHELLRSLVSESEEGVRED
ncbi:Uncharacterized protein SCF082_LOCUS15204 [Durusdinium trenchii]|uniref:Uncharacterized protein n=1 Tax=Durusdinium trenchii TaxID=1381693 RepID=A0ABP0K4C8_9DINO